jgi:peptide-methionine (S)-S-oxide reductase
MNQTSEQTDPKREVATLAGGCFWCLEAVFDELAGVDSVESGYTGGAVPNPTYNEVCSGRTGHAEAARITFDPEVVPYEKLLNVFFTIHDPTTLNRQGNDVGSQYRSAIYYHSDEQRRAAEDVIRRLGEEQVWGRSPIVTELAPAGEFYEAEDYHQEYFANNPYQPYCQAIIAPKVKKFRQKFLGELKAKQAT